MSERVASQRAWEHWRGDVPPILNTPPTVSGSTLQYVSKEIFDAGWQAAMQYRDELDTAAKATQPLITPELPTHE